MCRKNNNKAILVGPFPPPFHGQSISFKMLVDELRKEADIKVVNISGKNIGTSGGKASFGRVVDYLFVLFNFALACITHRGNVYITISQSKHGFIRDFFMIWCAYLFGLKVTVHLKGGNYHGLYRSMGVFGKFLIRHTLRRVSHILVLGKNLVSMYDFDDKLSSKIYVVENGLPFDDSFDNLAHNIEQDGCFNVLFLSNMIESKGYLDVLKAANILVNESGYKNLKFYFAGNFCKNTDDKIVKSVAHAKEMFEAYIVKNKLESHVKYLGTVSGEDKIDLLRSSHLFILPTNYNNEGQPVSIIEAISFGLPIVATNYRAISDMIEEGGNGLFVEYGNEKEISAAIESISQDKETWTKFSSRSRQKFLEKFTTEKHIERIKKHILN